MIRKFTDEEYKETMSSKMQDVTETAEPTVDIWSYVEQLVKGSVVLEYVFEKQLVEKVYRNDESTFDHVLLPTNQQNNFVVIIVDLKKVKISGYYSLDLNKEYGLKTNYKKEI